MAFDENLADRMKRVLNDKRVAFVEKRMFGGMAFMVDEKMCVGIIKDEFMARIDPNIQEDALKLKGSRTMDFTGRPMKGYIQVSPEGVDLDEDLDMWIQLALDFNPKAKSSKKKSSK
jgi:TfoX/Sxy family transcriptional regulator of competence genes